MEPPLITRQRFVNSVANGIDIGHHEDFELDSFGERMIKWINDSDNSYWAGWDYTQDLTIAVDLKHFHTLNVVISPGKVELLAPPGGIQDTSDISFGYAVVGVILFCAIENGEIEEVPYDESQDLTPEGVHVEADKVTSKVEDVDFDWI